MKLTVLSENSTLRPELEAEFGLSVYLEKGDTRLLFDTGTSGICVDNAKKLGVDLTKCTAVAFSHNHDDHCGGFIRVAEELKLKCPIYAHQGFFRNKYWDHRFDAEDTETYAQTLEHVGPPFGYEFLFRNNIESFRLLPGDVFHLGNEVYLLGNFDEPSGIETVHPSSVMENFDGSMSLDRFSDEQVCVVKTSRGLVVLTGCAHSGIMNIMDTVMARFPGLPVVAMFGGTHLLPPNDARIEATLKYFTAHDIPSVGVCHCTGAVALERFSDLDCYVKTATGFIFETED